MKYIKFITFLLLIHNCLGQNEAVKWGFDTNYVKRYNDRLVLAVYQSQRTFEIDFIQKMNYDPNNQSALLYVARSNKVTGLSLAYDKISFSYGFKTPVSETELYRRGKTKYNDYSFSFTSSKFRIETAYRNYKGFYDEHTARYDTLFNDTLPYFQRPEMKNVVVKLRGFYFFNHKRFSYGAAYNNTYRQVKTAGSFIAYTDVFYNLLTDPEHFLPTQVMEYYQDYKNLNSFENYGVGIGGGYTLNLVLLKSLYVNGVFGLSGKFFQQNLSSSDDSLNSSTFRAGINGADLRGAIGYNGKNFFISAYFNYEISVFGTRSVNLNSKLISGSFTFGYRFPFKERKWVKKIKENKLYQKL